MTYFLGGKMGGTGDGTAVHRKTANWRRVTHNGGQSRTWLPLHRLPVRADGVANVAPDAVVMNVSGALFVIRDTRL